MPYSLEKSIEINGICPNKIAITKDSLILAIGFDDWIINLYFLRGLKIIE